jgi:cell wall-associated NlpC family hydrolase
MTTIVGIAASAVLEARARVVAEAESWLGTPYQLGQRVKGAGCDCVTFIVEVFRACGIYEPTEELGFYGREWWANAKDDLYLLRLMRYAAKTAEAVSFYSLNAAPGNILLVRAGDSPVYNHGGIVLRWPRIAHAIVPKVAAVNAPACSLWANKQVVVLDPFLKKFQCQAS